MADKHIWGLSGGHAHREENRTRSGMTGAVLSKRRPCCCRDTGARTCRKGHAKAPRAPLGGMTVLTLTVLGDAS